MSRTRSSRIALLGVAAMLAVALLPGSVLGKQEYSIAVTKSANPTSVAAGGASVTYTVTVQNTGTQFFQVVNLSDTDCTLSGPTAGDDGDGKLEEDETWTYTCTVANVVPPHTNTVTVNACHDGSVGQCNQESHNATGTAQATVTVAAAPSPTPTPTPTGGQAASTLPPTDKISGTSSTSDSLGLVLMALAGVLASILVLTPARARRR